MARLRHLPVDRHRYELLDLGQRDLWAGYETGDRRAEVRRRHSVPITCWISQRDRTRVHS